MVNVSYRVDWLKKGLLSWHSRKTSESVQACVPLVTVQVLWDHLRCLEFGPEDGGESEASEAGEEDRYGQHQRQQRRAQRRQQDPSAAGPGRGVPGRTGESQGHCLCSLTTCLSRAETGGGLWHVLLGYSTLTSDGSIFTKNLEAKKWLLTDKLRRNSYFFD